MSWHRKECQKLGKPFLGVLGGLVLGSQKIPKSHDIQLLFVNNVVFAYDLLISSHVNIISGLLTVPTLMEMSYK